MLIRLIPQPLLWEILWVLGCALALAIVFLVLRAIVLWLRPVNVDRTGNGIAVSPIKIYDNRFLTIRLDELQKGLEKLSTLDSSSISGADGNVQGKIASDTDLTFASKPSSSDKKSSDQKGSDQKGAGGVAKSQTGDEKLAPTAEDRLSELVNLQYEILGLRMILERSLSDRLWKDGDKNNARLQAVLGIQVSLDPPADAVRSAAVVEVTFRESAGKPLSVVALLPQERSHNLLFTTSQTQNLDGSLSRAGNQWSALWSRRRQSSVLLREPDTIAFERPPQTYPSPIGPIFPEPEQDSLTVGWQFRPPLDQPAVLPGMRQVFAILALPTADRESDSEDSMEMVTIHATVRTYWRRYNRGSRTTSPRWAWLPWIARASEREDLPHSIQVNATKAVQRLLKPEVTAIRTSLVSPSKVLVMIDGRNFFPGTTVAIGKSVHDADNGLLIKSDYHMQVTTTPEALASGNGEINGRYGPTVMLKIDPPVPSIYISNCTVELSGDGKFDWLQIQIANAEDGKALTLDDLKKLPDPIVTVDEKVLPPPFYLTEQFNKDLEPNSAPSESQEKTGENAPSPAAKETKTNCVEYAAWVPSRWNPTSARFKLIFPFCGTEYQQAFGLTVSDPSFVVSRWRRGPSDLFLIEIHGGDFEVLDHWSVELDQIYPLSTSGSWARLSNRQALLCVPHAGLSDREKIIVHFHDPADKSASAYPLPIPVLAEPPKPSVSKNLVELACQAGALLKLEGVQLDQVDKVTFVQNGSSSTPEFLASENGAKITVFFPTAQTAGFAELFLQDGLQAEIGRVPVLVKPKA